MSSMFSLPTSGTSVIEAELPKALSSVGVTCRSEVKFVEGKHLAFTDSELVFVKMIRPGQDWQRLATELAVGKQGIHGVRKALTREVLEIFGQKFIASKYVEGMSAAPENVTPQQAVLMAQGLINLHQHPVDSYLRSNLDSLLSIPHRVRHKVSTHPTLSDETVDQLVALVEDKIGPLRSLPSGLPRVLVHGDAHAHNFVVSPDQTDGTWVDLEKAKLAPVEWDIASLRYSLLVAGKNKQAWDAAEEIFLAVYPDMNSDLVDSYEQAVTVINTVNGIWNGNLKDAEQRAQELVNSGR